MSVPDASVIFDSRVHVRATRRAFTRIEAIVVVICIVLIVVLFVPVFLQSCSNRHGLVSNKRTRDATHIRGIHQSWLVFAREFDGSLPTPGLMKRLSVNGVVEPGRGEEDISQNTTANLHSMCIMQNYYTAEICVSPTEPNPAVRVQPSGDYNYDLYKPASSSYWDPTFTADLKTGSNVSYASMPMHGQMREQHWRERLDKKGLWPIIGSRGPLDGVHDANSFTLRIHPPFDQWSGNICFADNRVEFYVGLPTAAMGTVNTQGFFRDDGGADPDGILTFVKSMSIDGPEIQHD